jgi:hypothetical protein
MYSEVVEAEALIDGDALVDVVGASVVAGCHLSVQLEDRPKASPSHVSITVSVVSGKPANEGRVIKEISVKVVGKLLREGREKEVLETIVVEGAVVDVLVVEGVVVEGVVDGVSDGAEVVVSVSLSRLKGS